MTLAYITKDEFTIPRTPSELAQYVRKKYEHIATNGELKEVARLHKEPYKTFLEELIPFSHFSTWKYGDRDDVQCALVSGTPGRDATITDINTHSVHSVEITWPIDGRYVVCLGKQLNERSYTDMNILDYDDTSQLQAAISRTLEIAKKKAVRDYREPGGSSIIFVFDHSLFRDSNQNHVDLLQSLRTQLSAIPQQADNVLLMLVFGDQKRIIEV